jgi:hypothetical protein
MSNVIYKNYTIKLRPEFRSESGKWEPFAMVGWQEHHISIGHPISSGELQDTEILANALALERAKAWVGAQEEAQGGSVSPGRS